MVEEKIIPSPVNDCGRFEFNPDQTKATVVAGRKLEFAQTVMVASDSLVLALYDNGEIDGDTVSVYLNGEVIMPKQGLKASAIRKTIYMSSAIDDEITLVLFADNLGKYPPIPASWLYTTEKRYIISASALTYRKTLPLSSGARSDPEF
jgi:hypothetical protein